MPCSRCRLVFCRRLCSFLARCQPSGLQHQAQACRNDNPRFGGVEFLLRKVTQPTGFESEPNPARSPYHYGINTGSIRISSVLIPYLSRNDKGSQRLIPEGEVERGWLRQRISGVTRTCSSQSLARLLISSRSSREKRLAASSIRFMDSKWCWRAAMVHQT